MASRVSCDASAIPSCWQPVPLPWQTGYGGATLQLAGPLSLSCCGTPEVARDALQQPLQQARGDPPMPKIYPRLGLCLHNRRWCPRAVRAKYQRGDEEDEGPCGCA